MSVWLDCGTPRHFVRTLQLWVASIPLVFLPSSTLQTMLEDEDVTFFSVI